jgi:hypothetical protein
MDIAELAARLAEKSKKPGQPSAAAHSEGRVETRGGKTGTAKQRPAQKRPSIAKKAAGGRWSVPRTSGK